MTNLFFEVSSYGEISREADPDDKWDRASTYNEHTLERVSLKGPSAYELCPVGFDVKAGDVVHVLHAQWSTGDSFGHDEGYNYEVIGVYQDKETATRDLVHVKNDEPGNLEAGYPWAVPWNGYFESLDWIKVKTLVVEGN